MKKLADGKDNQRLWKVEATCTGRGWNQEGKSPCYALWEVSAMDIMKRVHTDISGDSDTYYGFLCPECGCFTELPSSDVPNFIRTNAKQYVRVVD